MESTAIDQAVAEGTTLSREEAIRAIVEQEIPPQYLNTRKGRGGKVFTYIKHGRVVEILNEAFAFQWSFEALPDTLRTLDDGGYGIFGKLTVWIGGREITKTEFGTKDFMKGMAEGDIIKSALSDALRRCAMRVGVALNLYLTNTVLTTGQVMAQLCTYAKNKAQWTPDQVRDFLKAKGYTTENLVENQNEAYRDLAAEIGKSRLETLDDEPAEEPETDPLVDMAEEELGAEATSATTGKQKVNFVKLYAYALEKFGFGSTETKRILTEKFGKEWWYTDKQEITKVLKETSEKGK